MNLQSLQLSFAVEHRGSGFVLVTKLHSHQHEMYKKT